MTRFTVVWLPGALAELAALWITAANRDEINRAVAQIDAMLLIDPGTKGSDVAEGLRKLACPPLQVYFVVSEQDRRVDVTTVVLSPN